LADAPLEHEPFEICDAYRFDNLKPLANGGGEAAVFGYSFAAGPISFSSVVYIATVVTSPATFHIQAGRDATAYVPSTCNVFEELPYTATKYSCEGGSVILMTENDGKCIWDGDKLICDCQPLYAPEAYDSTFGPRYAAPTFSDDGTEIVNGDAPEIVSGDGAASGDPDRTSSPSSNAVSGGPPVRSLPNTSPKESRAAVPSRMSLGLVAIPVAFGDLLASGYFG
jgi:hypothetical protein